MARIDGWPRTRSEGVGAGEREWRSPRAEPGGFPRPDAGQAKARSSNGAGTNCSPGRPALPRNTPAIRSHSWPRSHRCRLGAQRTAVRLQRYLATRDQHLDHDRDVPDGVLDPAHPESRHARDPTQAGRADHCGKGRREPHWRPRRICRKRSSKTCTKITDARPKRRSIISIGGGPSSSRRVEWASLRPCCQARGNGGTRGPRRQGCTSSVNQSVGRSRPTPASFALR